MANWTFDPSQYEEKSFELIPAGDYRARIEDVQEKTFRSGNEGYEITLAINGYAAKMWYYLVLDQSNAARTNQSLGDFFNSFGITQYNLGTGKQWIGKVGAVRVKHELYNGNKLTAKRRAQISQYAENVYFGKPSGLMDQMASSVGGLCFIDFKDPDPQVTAISYDFAKMGYQLVVVNTGGSHDDLTPAYAAIPAEMKAVAQCFDQPDLRSVLPEHFLLELPRVREALKDVNADRAIMRAAHYFAENRRVADFLRSSE